MQKNEIDIIIDNIELWDMLHLIYCLSHAPEAVDSINYPSDIKHAKNAFLVRLDEYKKEKRD